MKHWPWWEQLILLVCIFGSVSIIIYAIMAGYV